MKKFYCVICGKYRTSKNPKTSDIFEKVLVLSIICSKCKNEVEEYSKNKNQLRYENLMV